MKRYLLSIILALIFVGIGYGQMWNGVDSLYGNEWIDFDKDYYKFTVSEDGIYRISRSALEQSGFPINTQPGSALRLYAFGEQVPLYVSTDNMFGGSDYIEFFAEKNTDQLDKYLFQDPDEEQLNPEFSMYSNSSHYYLTWSNANNAARYENISNDLSNPGSPVGYFMYTLKFVSGDRPYSWFNSDKVRFSNYDGGEGFASEYMRNIDVNFAADGLITDGPQSSLSVRMASDILEHELEIKFNGNSLIEESFYGFGLRKYDFNLNNSAVNADNTLNVYGNADDKDRYAMAVAKLTYPRNFNFDGANSFLFSLQSSSKQYLEIDNFNADGNTPVLYDVTSRMRIVTSLNNGQIQVVLPQGAEDRKIFLSNNGNAVNDITSLNKINLPNLNESDANYIIITHPALNNANSGTNQIAEYAAFRSSPLGGNYDVKIVHVTDIYEIFGYGVERHPIAIRNFANFVKLKWTNPEMFFIIGKAREYISTRFESELNDPANETFYVPTFGIPGADNLLVSSGNKSDIPVLPVGRLAVNDAEEIATYLEKVKTMAQTVNAPQTIEDRAWMKNILHLSGGDVTLQNTIADNLKSFENIIENNTFGADVTTFYKTSTDPVQISESEAIFNLINNGVSLITFFGHSGAGTFDFNIDNPNNFSNAGKLPLIISLGCYSGNIHTTGEGISERFVLYEDKGAGAFLATTGPGYVPALNVFGREFYQKLGEDNYGDPLGKVIRESIKLLDASSSFIIQSLVQQLTLNGDPAIVLNPHPGPDFTVDNKSVTLNPAVLNAQLENFDLSFDVVNIGSVIRDSFMLIIEQQLPNGEKFVLKQEKIAAPFSKASLSYNLPNFGSTAAGLNRIFIKVDTENNIDELPAPAAEMNNSLIGADNFEGFPIFIFDNSMEPIFPADFGIVNDEQPVKLVSSSRDALVGMTKFIMELDTTESFNSPFKIRHEITQLGGVLNWEPTVNWEDEKVYYWRISPDSTSVESPFIWKNRSFTYLADSEPGWSQSHFYQYKKNEFDGMKVNPGENLEYLTNGFFITLRNKVNEPDDPPAYIYDFGNAASSVRPWNFINSGIAVVVGDKITGVAQPNPAPGQFGSVNPSYSRVFAFPTNTPAERQLVMNFLENEIPTGNYVWFFTVLHNQTSDFHPEDWAADEDIYGNSIFSLLESQGATEIRNLESSGSKPYTFIYKKDEEVLAEDLAIDFDETIVSEVFIPILRTSGTIASTEIGPAIQWSDFSWGLEADDDPADSTFVQIFGVNVDGSLDTLESNLIANDYDLSGIDATMYPNLRVSLVSEDDAMRTATDLTHWRVTYTGLPDIAIDPNTFLNVYQDTLNEGESFLFEAAITNTSSYPITNTEVVATFTDNGNSTVQTEAIKNLAPGESTNVAFESSSFNSAGYNNFLIEANPEDVPKELYRFNNIATYNYFVKSDNSNPLLEVTFDGTPIMNGDIVSAKPHVTVSLKDENPYLQLNDTSLLKLILKDPNGVTTGINFSDPSVTFYPAGQGRNEAVVEWDPTFEIDGDYELIVQGEDVTGNQSGALDYKIIFKIINKKMISNVLNYPNPFSTATRFVYTLTGDEAPAYFKIQIFSASGKIVKEITQDELGPMKVGTHQTDFVWDGTDDFGDRLANGVYFYKVVTKNAMGESYESYLNGNVDKFFEQGLGKLVIMR